MAEQSRHAGGGEVTPNPPNPKEGLAYLLSRPKVTSLDLGHHFIRVARHLRMWSQSRLAEEADISLRTVGNVENGRCNPSYPTREALLKALSIPTEYHEDIFGALPVPKPKDSE